MSAVSNPYGGGDGDGGGTGGAMTGPMSNVYDVHTLNADSGHGNGGGPPWQQLACLYTKHKTQKRKIWRDGRLLISGTRAAVHDANPPPGSSDPSLDECEITQVQRQSILHNPSGQSLESNLFLIEVEGPWVAGSSIPTSAVPTKTPSAISSSMKKLFEKKAFQKPKAYVPPPPHARPNRLLAVLGKRRRPLQPGELVSMHYGQAVTTGPDLGLGPNPNEVPLNQRQQTNHPNHSSFHLGGGSGGGSHGSGNNGPHPQQLQPRQMGWQHEQGLPPQYQQQQRLEMNSNHGQGHKKADRRSTSHFRPPKPQHATRAVGGSYEGNTLSVPVRYIPRLNATAPREREPPLDQHQHRHHDPTPLGSVEMPQVQPNPFHLQLQRGPDNPKCLSHSYPNNQSTGRSYDSLFVQNDDNVNSFLGMDDDDDDGDFVTQGEIRDPATNAHQSQTTIGQTWPIVQSKLQESTAESNDGEEDGMVLDSGQPDSFRLATATTPATLASRTEAPSISGNQLLALFGAAPPTPPAKAAAPAPRLATAGVPAPMTDKEYINKVSDAHQPQNEEKANGGMEKMTSTTLGGKKHGPEVKAAESTVGFCMPAAETSSEESSDDNDEGEE